MSKTIDEKVVSMKFDNSNFESNVKTTMSTLDKLKQSLNLKGASQGLENVSAAAKKCDVSSLGQSVDVVQAKFSALQVVGVTALANITTSVMGTIKKISSFATDSIIQGGIRRATNLENAHFQLQGLLKDEEAVSAVMVNVKDSVDGTAYSLDAAAKVASQLAASGMEAGDSMFKALRGVAGVAAMTNSSYEDIGRIYTQVAGQGRLMGDQLLQLSSRGMNAAATLATAMDKTESEIRDMVSKGEISFNDFAIAMDNAFGEHAKKANETFEGALSNIKAALGRIGALFVSPMIEQNGPLVQFFNAIRVKINEVNEAIQPFATTATTALNSLITTATNLVKSSSSLSDPWSQLQNQMKDTGVSADTLKEKLIAVARDSEIPIDDYIEETGSFEKSLKKGWLTADIFGQALERISEEVTVVTDTTEDMNEKLNYFQEVVDAVWYGTYSNGAERVEALTQAGYDYAKVQDLVNKTVDGHRLTLEDLDEEQLENIGYTEEQIQALNELKKQAAETGTPLNELISNMGKMSTIGYVFEGIKNIFSFFKGVLESIGTAWKRAFDNNNVNILNNLARIFYNLTDKIKLSKESIANLSKVFEALFSVVRIGAEVVSLLIDAIANILGSVLEGLNVDILGLSANVADVIIKFREWLLSDNRLASSISNLSKKVASFVGGNLSKLKSFISEIIHSEKVQNFVEKAIEIFDKLKETFKDVFGNLKDWFGDLGPIFSDFIEKARSLDSLSFSNIRELLGSLYENLGKHLVTIGSNFTKLTEIIESFRDKFLTVFNEITGGINGFSDGVVGAWSNIYDFFKFIKDKFLENFGFAEIFAVFTGAGIIVGCKKLLDVIDKLTTGLFKLSDGIAGVFGGIKSMLKAFGEAAVLKAKGEALKSYAIAIAILAVSFVLLSRVDPDRIAQAAGVMTGLVVSLGLLAFVLSKIGSISVDFYAGAAAIVSLAVSLILFAAALKMLNSLDPEKTLANTIILVIAMASMATIVGVLSHNVPKLAENSIALIAFAAGILILAKALQMLSDIKRGDADRSIIMLTALMLGLLAFSKLTQKTSAHSAKAGAAILAMTASLMLMVVVIKLISGLDPGEILKAIVVIGMFEILFAGIILATKVAGEYAGRSGLAILGFTASLLLMVAVVKAINTLSEDEIEKAIDVVSKFAIIFSLIILVSSAAGKYAAKAGLMLIEVAGAMLLLSAAAVVLSHVKPEGLDNALKAISVMGIIFTALIGITHFAKLDKDSFKSIIAMTVALGMLVVAIGVLSMIDAGKLIKAVASVSAVMLSFAALLASTSKIGKMSLKTVGTLAVMMTIIFLLTGVIAVLSKLESSNALNNTAALSILILSLSASLRILDNTKPLSEGAMLAMLELSGIVAVLATILGVMSALNVTASIRTAVSLSILLTAMSACMVILSHAGKVSASAIGAMAGLSLVVGLLGAILGALAYFDVNPSLETVTSLSILLLSLSACCVILGAAGMFGVAAFVGVGVLATLIVAVGALMVGLGALNEYVPEMETFLNQGLPMMALIGAGIGAFFGGIVAGFNEAASSDLGEIGDNLSDFMTRTQPFLDGAKNITDESVSGVDKLSDVILKLTEASLLDAITKFIGGGSSLASFGEQLAPFGESLKAYGDSVADLNTDAIVNSAKAGQALSDLANTLPKEDGLAQSILGSQNLDSFGSKLATFGNGLKQYGESVIDLPIDDIVASAKAGQALSDLANTLPKEDGLAQSILGSKDLGSFGSKLATFGNGLKQYGEAVIDLPIDDIVASAPAGQALSDLANTLPTADGLAQTLFGGKDLGSFGSKLATFGNGLKQYGESVIDLPIDDIVASAKAGQALSDLANALPDEQSWAESVFGGGQETLSTFGNNIESFGSALESFSSYDIDSEKIANSATAAGKLANLSIPEDLDPLKSFGGVAKTFGKNMKEFSDSLSGADMSKVATTIQQARNLISLINSMASIDTSGVDSFKSVIEELSSIDLSTISTIADEFNSAIPQFNTIGSSLIDALVNGMNSKAESVSSVMSIIMASLTNGIQSAQTQCQTIGSNIINGLSLGMISGLSSVTTVLSSLISTIIGSIQNNSSLFQTAGVLLMLNFKMGLSTGSDSTISSIQSMLNSCIEAVKSYQSSFSDAGGYLGEGLVNGINSKQQAAYDAGHALGQKAVQGEKDGQDSASPSKLTIKAGKWLGEGLIIGMNRMGKAVYQSGKSMGEQAFDSISNALTGVNTLVPDIDSVQPAIRPVIDMSNMNYQMRELKFGANIDALISQPVNSLASIMSDAQTKINSSNKEVVNAVNGLRKDLNTMYEADDQEIALYVDSRKLASSIVNPMNRQLNILSRRGEGL